MSEMAKHPNMGSSLDDLLLEDGTLDAVTINATKAVIAWQMQQEMERQHISKSAMAKEMKTSRVQLDRVLNPTEGNVTLETLQKAAVALGRTLKLELA